MELEEQVMGIIINVGQLCSLCYEVLYVVKVGDFVIVDVKMQEVVYYFCEVYFVQIQFIEVDEGEGKIKMMLVMVYVQDYLMIFILVKELIVELIVIYCVQLFYVQCFVWLDVLVGFDFLRLLCYILEQILVVLKWKLYCWIWWVNVFSVCVG